MNETDNYWIFSKSKVHNSAENYSTGPKLKLDLRILVKTFVPNFIWK